MSVFLIVNNATKRVFGFHKIMNAPFSIKIVFFVLLVRKKNKSHFGNGIRRLEIKLR